MELVGILSIYIVGRNNDYQQCIQARKTIDVGSRRQTYTLINPFTSMVVIWHHIIVSLKVLALKGFIGT
jgi:hypothetical protein